jgi:hypothetical protein
MGRPKYVIFNYEGFVEKTDDDAIAEQYKGVEWAVLVRTADGKVWGDSSEEWEDIEVVETPDSADEDKFNSESENPNE